MAAFSRLVGLSSFSVLATCRRGQKLVPPPSWQCVCGRHRPRCHWHFKLLCASGRKLSQPIRRAPRTKADCVRKLCMQRRIQANRHQSTRYEHLRTHHFKVQIVSKARSTSVKKAERPGSRLISLPGTLCRMHTATRAVDSVRSFVFLLLPAELTLNLTLTQSTRSCRQCSTPDRICSDFQVPHVVKR